METYVLEVDVEVREDDYNEGEGQVIDSFDYTRQYFVDSLEEALQKFYEDDCYVPGMTLKDVASYFPDQDRIHFVRTENEVGHLPSESEEREWKEGKILLRAVYYMVKVRKIVNVSPMEIKNLGINEC